MKQYGRIAGWGKYTPAKIITNHDLEKQIDTNHEWIVQRTGIHARHVAEPGETTCTMAVAASRQALTRAGLTPNDLDMIIVATSTPDHLIPALSSEVQDALGAKDVPAFQLGAGCAGFIYALSTAYQFIHSSAYRNILVVGAELLSRSLDWNDRATCILFGDAAAAMIVQATDQPCGLKSFVLGSDGSQGHHLLVPAGGSAEPFGPDTYANGRQYVQMNGREVFKFATRVIGQSCRQAVAKASLTLDDIRWIIPHQANLRIIDAGARQLGLPLDRFIVNIQEYANTASASVPLALIEALDKGQVQPSDNLLMVAFGAGLSWGAAVLQMSP
ncbi:MAG: ketoacyl-ACP synthase III [Ardenticatenales bacterium]|nr:ketoacyl-ACP synthase III [Ardenticatenales bacterium]